MSDAPQPTEPQAVQPTQAYPVYAYPPAPPTNTLAIISFVLGFVVSLGAVICGHLALSQIKRTGEGGRGFAIAGLVLGYVGLGAVVAIIVIYTVIFSLIIVRPGSGVPTEPKASSSSEPKETTAAEADGSPCLPANLVLTAVTDKESYAPGEQPQIGLSLKNTGSQSCSINMGSTVQELIILSGSEKYWDSKDCQSAPVDAEIVIEAGEIKSTPTIPWDRTRSSTSTCDAQRSPVTAGGASYHLSVKLGELTSEKTKQFLLNG